VAFADRRSGNSQALAIIKEMPLWHGVGPGNYERMLKKYLNEDTIPYEPWNITPVHNVPLLIVAEWGILPGLLTVTYLLYQYALRFRNTWPYLLPLIPPLVFDHYLLTQPAPLVYLVLLLMVLAPLPTLISANAAPPATSPTQLSPQ
jgi:hypothetical protein